MSQSTTVWNGCDVVLKLDNSSNVLTDISGSSNDVSIDFSQDIGDYKTFASKWKGRIPCGKDAKIKLKIVASKDTAEALKNILDWYFTTGGSKSIQIDAPDSTTGSDRFTGEVVLESFSIPLTADDASPVMAEVNLLPNGALSWATI